MEKTKEQIVSDYFYLVNLYAQYGAKFARKEENLNFKALDTAILLAEEAYHALKQQKTDEAQRNLDKSLENLSIFGEEVWGWNGLLRKKYQELLRSEPTEYYFRMLQAHESRQNRFSNDKAEFNLHVLLIKRELINGYDPDLISDAELKKASKRFSDDVRCIVGLKPSATVKYITERLSEIVRACNDDPKYKHPLADDPTYRFYGDDSVRLSCEFSQPMRRYAWNINYEIGSGSSTGGFWLVYSPKEKEFTLLVGTKPKTSDPEKAILFNILFLMQ